MVRKLVAATVSAALCLSSVTPAFAQDYAFTGFDAPRGATVTANLRIPFRSEVDAKATYGLTLGYGKTIGTQAMDGRTTSRGLRLADLRFDGAGRVDRAELVTFNLADLKNDRRLNMAEGQANTVWIIVGIVAAGVAVCLLADCFEDDDEDELD